jgi:hypothetical protein
LFISYNSAGSQNKVRAELLNAFSDRYFPLEQRQTFIRPQDSLKDIEGTYQATRRADSTAIKLLALIGQAHAKVDGDGVLHIDKLKDLRGHAFGWKQTGKDLWQQVDDQGGLFAIRAPDGRIERLAGSFPASQWQRIPWYEQDQLVFVMLGFSVLIVFSVLFAAILRLARRHIFRSTQPILQPGRMPLTALPRASAIYWMLLSSTVAVVFAIAVDEGSLPPTSVWDTYFLIVDILCGIAIGLSVFAVWSAARAWRSPSMSKISRIKFTLVASACVFLSWFTVHWNLIAPIHRL